jgi:hypothetical protein
MFFLTPKALANFSPGLELATTLGPLDHPPFINAESVARPNAFSVQESPYY